MNPNESRRSNVGVRRLTPTYGLPHDNSKVSREIEPSLFLRACPACPCGIEPMQGFHSSERTMFEIKKIYYQPACNV
ncbi:hypothetical protein [Roseateles sp. LYH14W]|uniref:Uncharacterized protein n=1 Tax=Pelomonas parva TaxID=3299032 RepID=A0ABW7EWR7_9BURK